MESQGSVSSFPLSVSPKRYDYKTSSISKLINKGANYQDYKSYKHNSAKSSQVGDPFPALLKEERETIKNLLDQEKKRLKRKLSNSKRDVSHLHDKLRLDALISERIHTDSYISHRDPTKLPMNIEKVISSVSESIFLPQIKSPKTRSKLEKSFSSPKYALSPKSTFEFEVKNSRTSIISPLSTEYSENINKIGTTGRQDVINLAS